MNDPLVIGVDFGTSSTVVSEYYNGGVSILEINGMVSFPTIVSYDDDGNPHVGVISDSESGCNNVVRNVKCFFGKRYSEVNSNVRLTSNLYWNSDNDCCFKITEGGKDVRKGLVDVTADVFQYIADNVMKDFIKRDQLLPSDVYISVGTPADYSLHMQEIVRSAIERVTFNNQTIQKDHIIILSEPLAAAYTYIGFEDRSLVRFIIFDFGAGTLDVSLVEVKGEENSRTFTVVDKRGNNDCGGNDVDMCVYDMVMNRVKELCGMDIELEYRSREKLLKECRIKKESMSNQGVQEMRIDLSDIDEFQTCSFSKIVFSLDDFLAAIQGIKERAYTLVQDLLDKHNINDISLIPVGGSSQLRGLFDWNDHRIHKKDWIDCAKNVSIGVACIGAISIGMVHNKDITFREPCAHVDRTLNEVEVRDVLSRSILLKSNYGELEISKGTPYEHKVYLDLPEELSENGHLKVEAEQVNEVNQADSLGTYMTSLEHKEGDNDMQLCAYVDKSCRLHVELSNESQIIPLHMESM